MAVSRKLKLAFFFLLTLKIDAVTSAPPDKPPNGLTAVPDSPGSDLVRQESAIEDSQGASGGTKAETLQSSVHEEHDEGGASSVVPRSSRNKTSNSGAGHISVNGNTQGTGPVIVQEDGAANSVNNQEPKANLEQSHPDDAEVGGIAENGNPQGTGPAVVQEDDAANSDSGAGHITENGNPQSTGPGVVKEDSAANSVNNWEPKTIVVQSHPDNSGAGHIAVNGNPQGTGPVVVQEDDAANSVNNQEPKASLEQSHPDDAEVGGIAENGNPQGTGPAVVQEDNAANSTSGVENIAENGNPLGTEPKATLVQSQPDVSDTLCTTEANESLQVLLEEFIDNGDSITEVQSTPVDPATLYTDNTVAHYHLHQQETQEESGEYTDHHEEEPSQGPQNVDVKQHAGGRDQGHESCSNGIVSSGSDNGCLQPHEMAETEENECHSSSCSEQSYALDNSVGVNISGSQQTYLELDEQMSSSLISVDILTEEQSDDAMPSNDLNHDMQYSQQAGLDEYVDHIPPGPVFPCSSCNADHDSNLDPVTGLQYIQQVEPEGHSYFGSNLLGVVGPGFSDDGDFANYLNLDQPADPDVQMDIYLHPTQVHDPDFYDGDYGSHPDVCFPYGHQAEPDVHMNISVHPPGIVDPADPEFFYDDGDYSSNPDAGLQYGLQAETDEHADINIHHPEVAYPESPEDSDLGSHTDNDMQHGQESESSMDAGYEEGNSNTVGQEMVQAYENAPFTFFFNGMQRPWNIQPQSDNEDHLTEDQLTADEGADMDLTSEGQPYMNSCYAHCRNGTQRPWNIQPQDDTVVHVTGNDSVANLGSLWHPNETEGPETFNITLVIQNVLESIQNFFQLLYYTRLYFLILSEILYYILLLFLILCDIFLYFYQFGNSSCC